MIALFIVLGMVAVIILIVGIVLTQVSKPFKGD